MGANFLMTGAKSQAAMQQAQVEAEIKKQEAGKMFRFWLNDKEKCLITFVDGDLDENGYFTPPRYFEHNLYHNGKWGNTFVCPQMTCPDLKDTCPHCEGGDKPSLVSLFTVIDHRQFQSKDKTKVYENTRKLLVAKTGTAELLNNQALKRNGLAGATFEVSRTGDKAPSVGSNFDFEYKTSIDELKKKYVQTYKDPQTNKMVTTSIFVPADYEKEIVFRDGDELRKMGFGKPAGHGAMGMSNPGGQQVQIEEGVDYASQL